MLVLLAFGAAAWLRAIAAQIARSLEIGSAHVAPGTLGYLAPVLFAWGVFALGDWLLRGRLTLELAMTLLVLAATSAPAAVADLGMPAAFASYRSWRPLLAKPHPVSMQLWLRCMRPTPADWEAERRRVGPHAERYIMVYGSPPASKAASARQPFPPGAIIAKAKLRSPGEAPDGVAFMIKDPDGGFKDSGGWEGLCVRGLPAVTRAGAWRRSA
jgi:hypothetical protein